MFIQRIRHIVIEKEIYSNNSPPIVVFRLTHFILYCVFDNPFNESKLYSINSRAFILDCFPIKLAVSIDTTLQSIIHDLILSTLSKTFINYLIVLWYGTVTVFKISCYGNFWWLEIAFFCSVSFVISENICYFPAGARMIWASFKYKKLKKFYSSSNVIHRF